MRNQANLALRGPRSGQYVCPIDLGRRLWHRLCSEYNPRRHSFGSFIEGHMKKFLLGTSALIAAGLAGGAAQAADPIKVGIEGYVSWVLAFGNQTNVSSFAGTGDRFDQIKWDGEIQF